MHSETSTLGVRKITISLLAILSLFTLSQVNADMCIQVIQPAINDSTKECKEFPTPCDVPNGWTKTDSCPTTDTQLIPTKTLNPNFEVKKFESCSDMKKVIKTYVKNNYSSFTNYPYYRWGPIMLDDAIAETSAVSKDAAVWWAVANESKTTNDVAWNFSETNSQVANVDEAEIVKTDWKYIYYYNSADQKVYIAEAYPVANAKIVKKISLPSNFINPKIFINWKKLTILATKYSTKDYSYFWFNRDVKTAVVVYDLSDLENLKIDRYYQVDWDNIESRKIGNYIYVISKNNFSMPYWVYYGANVKWFNETKFDSEFSAEKILPEKSDMTRAKDKSQRNVRVKGKLYDYNIISWNNWNCSDIEYIMPNEETIKQGNFNPSIVTLSIIDTSDSTKKVKTKLLFGDVANIYMSEKNLYITSSMYTSENYACPAIMCFTTPCPQKCVSSVFPTWTNTIIHKISIDKDTTTYKSSTIVPGAPINQYSMDENSKGEFRILTSAYYPDRYTNLYILWNDLSLVWKLENIEKWEDYKSNRFIWNKLYLVTFKQIDPLFVIDLEDSANPKILWELKIPGYSTYLHPYDENHLIGIWYDTKENQWWGTQNDWIKVDLYDISDIKNPKQAYSLSLWDNYSSADALHDPRLFVWDKSKKMLYLTSTLYTSANDKNEIYRNSDVFQWTVAINIDAKTGIKEKARISHIDTTWLEEARQKECKQYANTTSKPQCVKVIGGWEYCPPVNTYVPPYCYEWSSTWEYLVNTIWNQANNFITRNIFMDDYLYSISNVKIQISDTNANYSKIWDINFK